MIDVIDLGFALANDLGSKGHSRRRPAKLQRDRPAEIGPGETQGQRLVRPAWDRQAGGVGDELNGRLAQGDRDPINVLRPTFAGQTPNEQDVPARGAGLDLEGRLAVRERIEHA